MTSTNNPQSQERVPETTPSRPGIKFVLCLVVAVIAVTILVLRN